MTDDQLFAAEPLKPPEKMSPDRRRTARQRALIAAGLHPLMVYAGYVHKSVRLHPEAPGDCAPDAPRGRPFTCGSCRFRVVVGWNSRSYPKCVVDLTDDGQTLDTSPRASHGAATDVRAWWPACRDYEPGDQAVSVDAARCIPEETR